MFFQSRNLTCVFFALAFVCVCALPAQSAWDGTIVPLTVDEGFPLKVTLTEKLHFKENEPVHAKVVEAVYAFDREVIPMGTEVIGRITGFRSAGKWKRAFMMVRGDFTPLREPQITFDTLVFPDGTRVPIETSVAPGTEKLVRFDGDQNQSGKNLKTALMSTVQQPGKDGFTSLLWGLAPYRPQYLPATTHFNVVLRTPLHFGIAVFGNGALDELGLQPPAGTIVSARLLTPLNSHNTVPGESISAILTEPLFSADNRVTFPAGSLLRGEVQQVSAARKLHHNGQLAFRFTTIELPSLMGMSLLPDQAAHDVDGNLVAVQVLSSIKNLHIDQDGATRIQESKKRFIAPAIAFATAGHSIGASGDAFGKAMYSSYLGKLFGGFVGRGSGLSSGVGLPANISGAMFPPLGIGLHFFSAARSIYSNFLARGQDIVFPADTSMQIRLDKP